MEKMCISEDAFKAMFTKYFDMNVFYSHVPAESQFDVSKLKRCYIKLPLCPYLVWKTYSIQFGIFKSAFVLIGGIYLLYTPIWIPIDLSLIKQILGADYDSFSSHGVYHHKNDFISENIFTVEGEEWKALRSNLSPTFTPAKLKAMYDILYNFGLQLEAQSRNTHISVFN